MRASRLFVALVLAAATSIAAAQPATDGKQRALTLFQESDVHYKRGEFERAVELLREAYALYPEPILIYNLARALEGLGDLPGAIEQYERYLDEEPNIEDRGAIERRITTLKDQVATRPATDGGAPASTPPPDPPTPPVIVPIAPDVRASSPTPPSKLPWIVAGAGVVVLGGGGVFGYLSHAGADDARREPVQTEAVRLHDAARRDATIANVMFAAGGAIAIGGVVWGVLDARRGSPAPAPTVAGARVEVAPSWVGLRWELR